ncbi:molybdopterin-dependent oxidoreductase [Hoeflea sp. G2-23]|uniref:Molybdopterin-dependent oxidoreductase n=1 Tax=Hoeflea algicola TaxID=2983763 RepID=A0ABT3Z3N5_9HYPH|nr:molybdopterin-dependent oxidoreductase [Hoeflea algicola]MCY0146379.1 molybdopterin-dependent oxidoreductase [Hoeflea algicola]
MSLFLKALLVGATLMLGGISAQAADSDKVVLTVSGKVTNGEAVDFTVAELEALGTSTITTTSPWETDPVTFEGVPIAALLLAVGATGDAAAVVALNKYRTEIPVSDFTDHGVILASKKNGERMPISDKGPLLVVYPFDDKPELNTEIYHSRSAWQVRGIIIE